jgi:hypothetical protein
VLQLLETIAGHEMDEQGVALRTLLAETGNRSSSRDAPPRRDRRDLPTGRRPRVADSDLQAVGLRGVREVVGRHLAGSGSDTERVLGLGAVIGAT